MPASAALMRLITDVRALNRLLRANPCCPGLTFHAIDLLQLDLARQVEVSHGRFQPVLLNASEVGGNGRLATSQVGGDLHLWPAL
jgi:hypothetical protein